MSLSNDLMLKQISNDRALGASLLFPHRHRQLTPPFHVEIMDLWRCADELVSIEAFRQGAKTTLSEEFLLLEALFKNFNYLLIFGETYTKACQRIEAMKHELTTNQRIYTLFGKQRGTTWSENKIVLPNGVAIEAHGWEEEIRGYLHLGNRPDRAYLDDIETKERVRDTRTVDANWKKLHMQLLPAMDKELGKVRMTGTPLADDCMIRRAKSSRHWVSGTFPICDGPVDAPTTRSLWSERYDMAWIKAMYDHYAEEGLLTEFNQEYLLIPGGAQGKPFTEEMLHFADLAPSRYAPKVVIIDPARTVDVTTSDQTGHVTVSQVGSRIFVHQSGAEYWGPDEIISGAFDMSAKHDDAEVAIEKNSLDDWLLQPMRARMLTTGQSLKLRVLQAPQDRSKAQFILGLQPFFMAGDIILVGGRAAHPKLVSQLLNFPTGKRDCLNALAYALRVFSGVPVYADFSSHNIAEGYTPQRNTPLLLACNASGSETAAALVELHGTRITVLADFISPLMPNDAIPDIAMLIRACYPGRKITTWVPADVFDQAGRNPLIAALKSCKLPPQRGEHSSMARGSLSPSIRTEMHGRRLLLVDTAARHTLQALASGYRFPARPGGERAPEPERTAARTLIEALECLTYAVSKPDNATSIGANATNVHGTAYLSALPR